MYKGSVYIEIIVLENPYIQVIIYFLYIIEFKFNKEEE